MAILIVVIPHAKQSNIATCNNSFCGACTTISLSRYFADEKSSCMDIISIDFFIILLLITHDFVNPLR